MRLSTISGISFERSAIFAHDKSIPKSEFNKAPFFEMKKVNVIALQSEEFSWLLFWQE